MKNNRAICYISQSPYPIDPRVRREAEILESAGFEVDILCVPLEGESRIYKKGKITAYRVIKKNMKQDNIFNYLLLSITFFIKVFIKLNVLNIKRKYSIIQIHNMPEYHVFATCFQKILGAKIILDIHDLTPELFKEKWGDKNKKFLGLIKLFEKISCKYSDSIITVTQRCKEILISRGVPCEKITLVLNTANSEIFQYNSEKHFRQITSEAKLLYHGTVAERFGIHIAVEAMPEILKSIPNSKLFIYGKANNAYNLYIDEMISLLGLSNSVSLLDLVTREEIVQIMNDADIEIVPYISNEYMNLSLSTKLFECASLGLAVASTDLKSLRDVFDDSCIQYFNDSDPIDLANKIISLCLNPKDRKEKTINAKIAVESISGEVMAKRYLSVIYYLLKINYDNKSEYENNKKNDIELSVGEGKKELPK